MRTGRATGRAVSTKRVKAVIAIALGMVLMIAAAAPASAGGPNDLFRLSSHAIADAGWSTCPNGPSYIEEVCVDTGVFAAVVTTQTNGTKVKEPCIAVTQFIYTFDPTKNFFISEAVGELCGDAIQFRSKDLTLISASGTIPLILCTPNADGTDVICAPDGTSATVNLTWTGFGPRFHFANNDKFQLGPAMCLFHDTGIFRGATLKGTVTGLPVDSLGTNAFAGISDQTSMSLSLGGKCSR
jgi:hypothetical protein